MKKSLLLILLIALQIDVNAQSKTNMTVNQEAPVFQKHEITIDANPEVVWAVLSNINSWDVWNKRIKDPLLTKQIRIGTTFTWKTNGSKIKSRIHTVKLNKTLGWEGKAFGASAIHNWFLKPTNNGTRVIVEESMNGWFIKLFKKKMNKVLEDDMIFWLQKLKQKCETN